jgi:hypothetical protein
MAVWKWKVLEQFDDPENDRHNFAIVRFRKYVDQAAADADPNLDTANGFLFSWDSKRDKRTGHALFASDLSEAVLDQIAPNIIASLERKIAGKASLAAAVNKPKTGQPAPEATEAPAVTTFKRRWTRFMKLLRWTPVDADVLATRNTLQAQVEAHLKANPTDIDLVP